MIEFEFVPEHDGTLSRESMVMQALGAASVCWEHPGRAGVFQSERAKVIGDVLLAALDGPDVHLIDLRQDGWTVQHPMGCRPRLFECPVNLAAERQLTERPERLGRFECELDADGVLCIAEMEARS